MSRWYYFVGVSAGFADVGTVAVVPPGVMMLCLVIVPVVLLGNSFVVMGCMWCWLDHCGGKGSAMFQDSV